MGVDAVNERPGLRGPLDHAMTVLDEALALLVGSKVRVRQAERPDAGDTKRFDLRRPAPDPVVFHEDDPATREMLRRTLAADGWSIVEAEDGRVGLERVGARRPDLIVLDLMMPEVDGFEFVASMRERADWRTIPIVVITARDVTAEDRKRLNGYVERILQKGDSHREELLTEIRELVARVRRAETTR